MREREGEGEREGEARSPLAGDLAVAVAREAEGGREEGADAGASRKGSVPTQVSV